MQRPVLYGGPEVSGQIKKPQHKYKSHNTNTKATTQIQKPQQKWHTMEVTLNGSERQRMLTMQRIVAAIFGPVCRLFLGNTESIFVADFFPGSLLFCSSSGTSCGPDGLEIKFFKLTSSMFYDFLCLLYVIYLWLPVKLPHLGNAPEYPLYMKVVTPKI